MTSKDSPQPFKLNFDVQLSKFEVFHWWLQNVVGVNPFTLHEYSDEWFQHAINTWLASKSFQVAKVANQWTDDQFTLDDLR